MKQSDARCVFTLQKLSLFSVVSLLIFATFSGCSSGSKPSAPGASDATDSTDSPEQKAEAKAVQEASKSPKGEQKFVVTTLTPAQTFQGALAGNGLTSAILEVEEAVRKNQDDVPMVVTYMALLRLAGNGGDVQRNLARMAGAKGAKNPWFLLESGYGALSRKEFALAEYLFGKAERFTAGDGLVKSAVNHAYGVRLLMIGRQPDGVYEIRKAAGANYVPALLTLGFLGLKSGDYIGAERNFRIALASDGENLNAKMGLGVALRVRGRSDDAYPLIAQVHKQRANDRRVTWNYALALSEAPGKKTEALELLSKYFQLPGSLGDIDARANSLYQKLQNESKAPAASASAGSGSASPALRAGAGAAGGGAAPGAGKPAGGAGSPGNKAAGGNANQSSSPDKAKDTPKPK